jgi:hypothetical protein
MVNIIFSKIMSMEEAEEATGLKYLDFPDEWFNRIARNHDLNKDEYFKQVLSEIDDSDIPMPNVVRFRKNMSTHPFDKVSTGVRMLWLMNYYPNRFLYPSQWLGPNCYRSLFELGKSKDIIIYDDSEMLVNEEADDCTGLRFKDFHTGDIVELGEDKGYDYFMQREYGVW